MHQSNNVFTLGLLGVALACTSLSAQADIPAGSLTEVLARFASSTGAAISFDARQTAGRSSAGLQGEFAVDEGFAQILQGSGLQAERQANGTYVLRTLPQGSTLELGATRIQGQALDAISENTGSYITGRSSTATKLPMSIRETPQSVTVVTRQRMDDQGMRNLDDVLQGATGITVIKNGAERSVYTARGQLVDNLQIDGIPTNISNAYSMDAISKPTTDIYDRVEIVRGATGLLEGSGSPSAAINLVRKRPTAEPQVLVETSVGSWDDYKTMVDLSSALNPQGTLRGRTVITYNNANSYKDTAKKENQLFYGVVEADLDEDTLATLGFTYQKERNSGYDWSGLPAQVDDKFYPLSRSTSLTGKWNHLDKRNTTVFGDIQHHFGNDWKLVVAANQTWAKSDFLGNFTMHVPGTVSQFRLQPRHFLYDDTQTSVDTYLSGPFQLFNRQHELILGSNVRVDDFDYHGGRDPGYNYVFDLNDPGSFKAPLPSPINVNMWKYNITQKQAGVYGAGRFSLTDSTRLILGTRVSWFKGENLTSTASPPKSDYARNGEITPYAGLVQDLNEHLTAYASYTEIFKPQNNLGVNGAPLEPMTGSNYEMGLKGEFFDKRLTSSLALFQSYQTGRAEYLNDSDVVCPTLGNGCYRASEKVRNRGIDLELNGALTPDWNLSAGYTYTQSKYVSGSQKGADFSASAPRHLLKIATDYRLPGALNKARVGGSFSAQSGMTAAEGDQDYKIQQKAYTLTHLHAVYEINQNLEVQGNLSNVFDKKYMQTVGNPNYWQFYGEPRNFNVALRAKY